MSASAIRDASTRAGSPGHPGNIPDGLRNAFAIGTLLLVWVRLDPFHDLSSVSNIEASDGGSLGTQIAFSLLGCATIGAFVRLGSGAIRALACRFYVLLAAAFAASVLFSASPSLSLRRVVFVGIGVAAAAALLLLARSVRHLAALLAGTALAIVAVCFLSLVLVPDLAMHTALDLREPEHAGAWRGLFSHKNEAGAIMAVFVLIGIFAARVGHLAIGGALAILAAIFLLFTASKTAVAVLPPALVVSWLAVRTRSAILRAAILLGPVLVLLLATVGTVFFPPVRAVVGSLLADITFTGRSEIWQFAADHIARRPWTGWGFGAFWKTEATLYGGSDRLSWVNQADQAHNGYLDLALTLGLPGFAAAMGALAIQPLRDLSRVLREGPADPATFFFLSVWVFGMATGAFESIFFDQTSSVFFVFTLGVFGLRYTATHGRASA